MEQYQVLVDYEVNDPHPLNLPAGTPVNLIRKDAGWPGWVWIEAEGAKDGWIPESFLEDASARSTLTSRAFDGTDLSATRGEIITRLEEAPGWIFGKRESGETGWFPLFNLRPSPRT